MCYGLTAKNLHDILEIFTQNQDVEQAILYGSRAKGTFRPGSDIDITLKGRSLKMASLFKIMEQLEQLDLPYEIDLSLYSQIENTSLLEHIERVGKVIFKGD
ncbi:nucleotidyltransferase domain-containing protein [uncultured Paraglaciecola sp.]|uniref:nucleotidyltransferase domain-containing protein n=1 Tax=uncultured Paraglaciecola sp. TaxID=1765024 RepID=UPI00260CBF87|nr:nucleotidyltransferase domain-containing protein [uncultured Paraglaciecola sp.]